MLSIGRTVRSDITRSFIGSTDLASGTQLQLNLTMLSVDGGGRPVPGCAVYVWHCDARGRYSLYGDAADESWLRGVQVADPAGRITFRTVYPGAYDGRFPHVHIEVFESINALRRSAHPLLTTQLAMPLETSGIVYADATLYANSLENLRRLPTGEDPVFFSSSPGEIAQQTLVTRMSGGRLVGEARVGLPV